MAVRHLCGDQYADAAGFVRAAICGAAFWPKYRLCTLVYSGCSRFDAFAGGRARTQFGGRDGITGQCAGRDPGGYARARECCLRKQPNGEHAIGRLYCAWLDIMAWRRNVVFYHTDDPLRLYARRAFV